MKILWFKSTTEFRSWLKKNHTDSHGIWLRIFKKGSGEKSISYAEALDQAVSAAVMIRTGGACAAI